MLDFQNRDHTEFQFNWSINFRNIVFKLILICKFQNVLCALNFEVERSNSFCRNFRTRVIILSMNFTMTTAVEQAVICAPVTQRARVPFPVGTSFLGEVFRGISSSVRQMSGSFRPTRSPNIIWLSWSSFHIEWVRRWYVSSFMFVLFRRWPRHWADPSSEETHHVLVW